MSPAGERVLIVEDEALVAILAEQVCQDAGLFVCGVAATEDDAVALAAMSQPTVALVDVRLAPGDGRRVAHHLRVHWKTAIVYATAYDHDLKRDELLPSVLLAKPYDFKAIVPALAAARRLADNQDPRPLPPGAVLIGKGDVAGAGTAP